MNWRSGLFRLWLIGSVVWMIGWVLFIRGRCHALPDGALICRNDPTGALAFLGDFATWTPAQLYLLGLSPPLAVLVAVSAIALLIRLRRGAPSTGHRP